MFKLFKRRDRKVEIRYIGEPIVVLGRTYIVTSFDLKENGICRITAKTPLRYATDHYPMEVIKSA